MIAAGLDDYDREYLQIVIRGSRLLHADETTEIYSIENRRAAAFWFGETKWCVKENPWLEGYLEKGPLLLLRSIKLTRDYLLAPAHSEFRNHRNRRVSLTRFVSEHSSASFQLTRLGVYWDAQLLTNKYDERIYFCPNKIAQSIWSNRQWLNR